MSMDEFEVKDPRGLSDADWSEINKLREAHKSGGDALSKALANLGEDPVRYIRVMGAFFPDSVREAIKDEMAECGIDENDLRELVRKLESPARDQ